MILEIKKVSSQSDLRWEVYKKQLLYGEATQLVNGNLKRRIKFDLTELSSSGVDYYEMFYNPTNISSGTFFQKHGFYIYENDGNAPLCCIRKHILGGLPHFISLKREIYVMDFDSYGYLVYDILMGTKGRFLFVYRDDKVVAAIHHPNTVVNFHDCYTVYADENEIDCNYLVMLVLFWDVSVFDRYEADMVTGIKINSNTSVTLPKVIREKYDPDFIPRIKAMDGIYDK